MAVVEGEGDPGLTVRVVEEVEFVGEGEEALALGGRGADAVGRGGSGAEELLDFGKVFEWFSHGSLLKVGAKMWCTPGSIVGGGVAGSGVGGVEVVDSEADRNFGGL